MGRIIFIFMAAFLAVTGGAAAGERVICTLVQEVGVSAPLVRQGQCDDRISSASTFKVAISLMGFDAGILTSPDAPEWPFKPGYADWNPVWRQVTTPKSWMRDSVVWYSQRMTEQLGADRFAAYVAAFDYGNMDVSGDAGKANGLTRAWLSSSLQISPAEQVAFLTRMIEGQLPVSAFAVDQTWLLMDNGDQPGGWHLYGKTGAGLPFDKAGQLLRGQPFGWYVGWADNGSRRVVFARLVRFDTRPTSGFPGGIARSGLVMALFGPDGALN
ncbi:class D beta-lactamase [Pseudodonghicola xiamenensis]|uniref:Beta-lactamase n=1 Tax=Pseudodonghicola xiamenensis TaxID=337702 RepID=A0A8J3MCB1_9RHOB|nr:class D beta-lactamase [Pseudodonghicola xiamenensis]GHG84964.1 beta-lactamase [Pseudodonghicola xiamenensis]